MDDSDTRVTFINKVSHHTEGWFSEILNEFYGSSTDKCVLLVKVNMQETSVKAVNHIRVMVEDAENHHSNKDKLAVVLLHYPLSMFSCNSYPSLFQFGWSHYYLDSVSIPSYINTKQWFSLTLDSPKIECTETSLHTAVIAEQSRVSLETSGIYSEIVERVLCLIEQNIPTIISLLASKLTINADACHQQDKASRVRYFFALFNGKGFGKVFCHKFVGYLNPCFCAWLLKKAASMIFTRESSSRMNVIIQNILCQKFSEFTLYIVSVMNESGSMDVVFDPDSPPHVLQLLKEVVRSLDLPEFSKLTHLSIIRGRAKLLKQTKWQFPFYSMISNSIEDIITECKYHVTEKSFSEESMCLPAGMHLLDMVEDKLLEIYQVSHSSPLLLSLCMIYIVFGVNG